MFLDSLQPIRQNAKAARSRNPRPKPQHRSDTQGSGLIADDLFSAPRDPHFRRPTRRNSSQSSHPEFTPSAKIICMSAEGSPDVISHPSGNLSGGSQSSGLVEVRYEYTPLLPQILQFARVTLLVSTYQAGKVLALGSHAGQATISFCHFDRAMGLAVDRTRIAVGTRRQIHFLKSAPELGPQMPPAGTRDGCWLPRTSFYTGNIHGHELAWGTEGLWVVNSLFSSLCTLHEDFSFVPRWQPKFITELQAQDRCHLNGLAMQDGRPKFVTAMAESNEPAGWRPTKATSGCVIDVPSGETILRGLAMPHSPRLHAGRLWVLNSGCGQLGTVDLANGVYEPVETVPGYTRGLAFAGQFAFVGLSRIRETSIFGGVPIAEDRHNLKCGVAVIDLNTGRSVAAFQFHSGVEEIFAIDVIPQSNAHVQGPAGDRDEEAADIWLAPPPGTAVRPETHGAIFSRPGQS
jgi:protein O-GlcNAc transferase